MAAVDPGAIYTQTLADLGLQEGQTIGRIEEGETNLHATYGTINPITGVDEGGSANAELARLEPGTYKAESNRANKGGILTSGVNTARKTTIAGTYAAKRTANQATLLRGLGNFQRERQEAGKTKYFGEHGAATTKAQQEDVLRAQNPVVTPTPAASAPLSVAAASSTTYPGVPHVSPYGGPVRPLGPGKYEYRGPDGTWVRVGGR